MDKISSSNLAALINGPLGLIIGPSVSTYPGCSADLIKSLSLLGDCVGANRYTEAGQKLQEQGISELKLIEALRLAVGKQERSAVLSHLSKARWCAVFSASLDSFLEELHNSQVSSRIGCQPMTALTDMLMPPPPGTIPCYKLLGNINRDDFVINEVTYLKKRRQWREAVRVFSDKVKGNSVLCIGMSDCPWVLEDLLAELLGEASTTPASLLLLADDPISNNSKISQLFKETGRLYIIDSNIGSLARELSSSSYSIAKASSSPLASNPLSNLVAYDKVVCVVNMELTPKVKKEERHRLLDILFSPSVTKWDPFAYDIDFKRTISKEILTELAEIFSKPWFEDGVAIVKGNAASGKTTILKRLAFDLAKQGELVLWMKPWFGQDSIESLTKIMRHAKVASKELKNRVVVFMDDPLSLGSITPALVASAAVKADIPLLLVVGVRTTDWEIQNRNELIGSLSNIATFVIEDSLGDDEWKELPKYLQLIGAATSDNNAVNQIDQITSRLARDTLSTLYWLLPSTRAIIESSIRDEYHRLGDMSGLTSVLTSTYKLSTGDIRKAYSMVAVAERFRAPLPIEILVTALGIDYSTWIALSKPDSAVWGIFYDEVSRDNNTVYYYCRNNVVTTTIVETLNGGTFGHSGELAVIQDMIGSAAGHRTPVYREFIAHILLPHNKPELQRFTGEEGLALYENALQALPYEDRVLLHHKGLWIKDKCNAPTKAKEVLKAALAAKDYPYTDQHDPDEFIHTSLAAATVRQIDTNEISQTQGKKEVLDHLMLARSPRYLNARVVHIQANLLLRLVSKEESKGSVDFMVLMNRALSDIDQMLLSMNYGRGDFKNLSTDIQMLENVKREVLVHSLSLPDIKANAEIVWEKHKSQEGFVLVCRKMFAEAVDKNKAYVNSYEAACAYMQKVVDAGGVVSPELYEAALEIVYYWRVRLCQSVPSSIDIDWYEIKNFAMGALKGVSKYKSPLTKHILALSFAHLGEWSDSNSIYEDLRRTEMSPLNRKACRDYLLNEKGGERLVQGVIHDGQGKRYLHVEMLKTDFLMENRSFQKKRDGETVHAYIRFTFMGPKAVEHV
jgi:hypothetical protein